MASRVGLFRWGEERCKVETKQLYNAKRPNNPVLEEREGHHRPMQQQQHQLVITSPEMQSMPALPDLPNTGIEELDELKTQERNLQRIERMCLHWSIGKSQVSGKQIYRSTPNEKKVRDNPSLASLNEKRRILSFSFVTVHFIPMRTNYANATNENELPESKTLLIEEYEKMRMGRLVDEDVDRSATNRDL
jgi:hypothetical protein